MCYLQIIIIYYLFIYIYLLRLMIDPPSLPLLNNFAFSTLPSNLHKNSWAFIIPDMGVLQ